MALSGPVGQNHREGDYILQLANRIDPFSEDKYSSAQSRCSPKGGKSQIMWSATGLFTGAKGWVEEGMKGEQRILL